MIKANELRVGNFVLDPNNNKICKVFILSDECEDNVESINGYDCICIEPVLLTEELLLKFGFEKSTTINSKEWDNYDSCPENSICIEFVDNEFYFTGGEGIPLSRKCKFVHEFQNLYFALKGVELVFSSACC